MSSSIPGSGTQTPLERDVVPELPTSSALAAAAHGEHFHHHGYQHSPLRDEQRTEDMESSDARKEYKRRGSTASRVAVDYFDPEGVHALRRTLTAQSQAARSARSIEHRTAPRSSGESTVVLETGEQDAGRFDLELFLKDRAQRCV